MRQLPLDLALPPRLGRNDFLRADANAAALDMVERWPDWPDRIVLLCGPAGSGKSHLGAIWADRAGATAATGRTLAAPDWPEHIGGATLLDDADRSGLTEPVLFHLLNLVRERGGAMLMTASAPPDIWGLRTPDLVSRLRLAPLVALGPPDDALLKAVLVKLFTDRQLAVDESVVAFLVLRLTRSLADARAVVDALDRTALALGRRVTRPMAATVLRDLDLDNQGALDLDGEGA